MCAGAAEYNMNAKRNNWTALCDASATFSHPDLRRLLGVWRERAQEGGVPLRREMTQHRLKSFLKDIVLYERVAGEDGARRWRVVQMGTSFAQIMGDMTGKFLDEAVPAELLPRWHGALDAALGHGAPLRFLNRADRMPFLTGEYFAAPLIADDGSASFILAAGRFTGGRSWDVIAAEARQALGLE
jgi:hypothetical protein